MLHEIRKTEDMPLSTYILLLLTLSTTIVMGDETAANTDDAPSDLRTERVQLDKTVWAPEVLAGQHERTIVRLWDRLRQSTEPLDVLAEFPLRSILIGQKPDSRSLELGIRQIKLGEPFKEWQRVEFQAIINKFREQGFRLEESEWHHRAFRTNGEKRTSVVDFVLHVLHRRDANDERKNARIIIRGKLENRLAVISFQHS